MDDGPGHDVVFYRLSARFVDSADDVPQDVQDIMYYTLAIGHHTGVIDCFTPALECTDDCYASALDMVTDKTAHYKLEGIIRHGEIQVDKSHVPELLPAVDDALERTEGVGVSPEVTIWLKDFRELLVKVASEPSLYVMGRRVR